MPVMLVLLWLRPRLRQRLSLEVRHSVLPKLLCWPLWVPWEWESCNNRSMLHPGHKSPGRVPNVFMQLQVHCLRRLQIDRLTQACHDLKPQTTGAHRVQGHMYIRYTFECAPWCVRDGLSAAASLARQAVVAFFWRPVRWPTVELTETLSAEHRCNSPPKL